jgi:hypothetical protein
MYVGASNITIFFCECFSHGYDATKMGKAQLIDVLQWITHC